MDLKETLVCFVRKNSKSLADPFIVGGPQERGQMSWNRICSQYHWFKKPLKWPMKIWIMKGFMLQD